MTTPEDNPVTIREQLVNTLRDLMAVHERNGVDPHVVGWVADWAQRLTLRGLTLDWAQEAQELYQEADQTQREGTRVACEYARICRQRADMYTQAAALLHQEVERRWPPPAPLCNGDGE